MHPGRRLNQLVPQKCCVWMAPALITTPNKASPAWSCLCHCFPWTRRVGAVGRIQTLSNYHKQLHPRGHIARLHLRSDWHVFFFALMSAATSLILTLACSQSRTGYHTGTHCPTSDRSTCTLGNDQRMSVSNCHYPLDKNLSLWYDQSRGDEQV